MWDESQWVLEEALAGIHELGSSGVLKVSIGPDDRNTNATRVQVGIIWSHWLPEYRSEFYTPVYRSHTITRMEVGI